MHSLENMLRIFFFLFLVASQVARASDSDSSKLPTSLRPFKHAVPAQPRERVIRGLLHSRQDQTCDPGLGLCPDGGCCTIGDECCTGAFCCDVGFYCLADGCCPLGETCTGSAKKKTPVGAIAGGTVGGVVFIVTSIILFFYRRRRNAAAATAGPTTTTAAAPAATTAQVDSKHGSNFNLPAVQAVSLPSSVGGYSAPQVVRPTAADLYPSSTGGTTTTTTGSMSAVQGLTVPPSLHSPTHVQSDEHDALVHTSTGGTSPPQGDHWAR
ncbi:hypothetical protein FB45DRAFT_1063454 [Roridomyces roridus]|uniref:Uncharacterized protein n=1 Tax=Roridomyces roridus TaxID=1738132 RepID=A0AAD7BD84_9AGAR|nr:hypothetical protein FB45DRAFT_1063454 [Roridomyces roridus]